MWRSLSRPLPATTADAVRHTLAAGQFAHAAALIERAMPEMRRRRQEGALLAGLEALPHDVV